MSSSQTALRATTCAVVIISAVACASANLQTADPIAKAEVTLPKAYPACEKEIRAFLRTLNLARQTGEDWEIYEPALEEMKDQVLDCIDDRDWDTIPT